MNWPGDGQFLCIALVTVPNVNLIPVVLVRTGDLLFLTPQVGGKSHEGWAPRIAESNARFASSMQKSVAAPIAARPRGCRDFRGDQWLRWRRERRWAKNSATTGLRSGDSDEPQLWERFCRQESLIERLGRSHWKSGDHYRPSQCFRQAVFCHRPHHT